MKKNLQLEKLFNKTFKFFKPTFEGWDILYYNNASGRTVDTGGASAIVPNLLDFFFQYWNLLLM